MESIDTLKEELRLTVGFIVQMTGKTQEDISRSLGYNKTYISEMLSPKGKVSEKFLRQLKASYKTSENPKIIKLVANAAKPDNEPGYEQKFKELAVQYVNLANAKLTEVNWRVVQETIATIQRELAALTQEDEPLAGMDSTVSLGFSKDERMDTESEENT